ncbi:hypothetical protein GCM10009717_23810 [Agromyces allii]|uniref:Uncharacterized protein n=1 Tax=Agromyces allii TaxID=393607 RepID=A0ABP5C5P1_9MICO
MLADSLGDVLADVPPEDAHPASASATAKAAATVVAACANPRRERRRSSMDMASPVPADRRTPRSGYRADETEDTPARDTPPAAPVRGPGGVSNET